MFQTLLNNPKKSLASALLMLSMGLLVLSCGTAWQHVIGPLLHVPAAGGDFIHGFSTGLGLTLEIGALVMLMRISYSRSKS